MIIKISIVSKLKTFIVLSFFILLTGCLSIKPSGVRSGKNLFESFFVGEEGTQYFIKPLVFLNIQNKEEIRLDFIFRYKNVIKDSVIVNFSLVGNNIYKNFDSLSLSNKTHKIKSKSINLLFNEKKSKLFYSRFSTKFSFLEFNRMFDNNDWTILVYKDKASVTYVSDKKSKRAIKKLQEKLFILFQ